MLKKLTSAMIAATMLVVFAPVLNLPFTGDSVLEARRGKLNYYRSPGGDPYCVNACDGVGVCCSYPGLITDE